MLGFPRCISVNQPVFDDFFGSFAGTPSFDIDAKEKDGNIVIRADLPGINKDDVSVTLENDLLTISAKRESQKTDDNVYLQECTFGNFCRRLRVPSDISDDVQATLKDGVLQLVLKRPEEVKPHKISISY